MNETAICQQVRCSDIRKQCAVHRQKKPCFICGKHKAITEAHHTIPLKELVRLLEAWGKLPEPPIVWLCPNCHTYVHRWGSIPPEELTQAVLEKISLIQKIGEEYLDECTNYTD